MRLHTFPLLALLLFPISACSDDSLTDPGFGPHPVLPEPSHAIIPTINPAKAVGWPQNGKPVAAQGFKVTPYAVGLDHPRWLYVLPNGDVLVAETNAPPKPEDSSGIKGWVHHKVMQRAGAATASANRITLLRGIDENGVVKTRSVFLEGLNSPFGMALVDGNLYIADTDALLRCAYHDGDTKITAAPIKVADLPAGPINHHWTKNVIASPDGNSLFVTVGSNSNAGENGLDAERNRAVILKIDPKTGGSQIFASGLRNPNGLAWQPQTKALWTTVNERDDLGDNLVPDYMTSVKRDAFYGWPYSYYGQHVDDRVKPANPAKVATAIAPDYALGNHTASLGLAFYEGALFPQHYKDGAFIGQHGSWNRKPRSGYKIIFIPFADGKPSGMPEDILTGFLDKDENAMGRPVGVVVDSQGALLVADDVGNVIWRVTPSP